MALANVCDVAAAVWFVCCMHSSLVCGTLHFVSDIISYHTSSADRDACCTACDFSTRCQLAITAPGAARLGCRHVLVGHQHMRRSFQPAAQPLRGCTLGHFGIHCNQHYFDNAQSSQGAAPRTQHHLGCAAISCIMAAVALLLVLPAGTEHNWQLRLPHNLVFVICLGACQI